MGLVVVQTFVGWGQSIDPLAARRSAGSAKVRAGPEEASLGEPRKREGSSEGVSVDESAKLRAGSSEEASVAESARQLAGSNEEQPHAATAYR